MAFWGVEVKPGKPFTHKYDDSKGRLHISMATLGLGTATATTKSTLQCNVGNKSPVYLCSLYPRTTESLQLNLELEEVDQVVFSVIGPRSIHLCGYYLATSRNPHVIDDSESYGEDIADTETERSDYSDEDEYEDSFIDDDGVPEVYPSSPLSNEEEASHDDRPKGRKGSLRRLRKKYHSVESDDDDCHEEKIIVNDSKHDQTKEIENEDSLPISSLYKSTATGKALDQEMDDIVDRGAGDASNKNGEDGGNSIIKSNLKTDNVVIDIQTHREAENVGDIKKMRKKKKGKEKETKSSCDGHSIKLDNSVGAEPKMEKATQDFVAGNEQHQQHADHKETVDHGLDEKPKKKRKEWSEEGRLSIANGVYHDNLVNLPQRIEHNKQHTVNGRDVNISDNVALPSTKVDPEKSRTKRKKKEQVNNGDKGYHADIIQEDKANSHNLIHKCFEEKEQHQKLANENGVDGSAHNSPDKNQFEDTKVKKKKKKNKSQGSLEVVNSDMPVSVEQSGKTEMMKGDRNKRADAKPSQVTSLSNGLVIQELEKGKDDGKIAVSGKKISVYYTGKLKGNEVVFESNAGQAPYKFRLGKGQVIKGWDVGLEGMQVGEKRRLIIPPSMTSTSDGQNAKIPSNSWLVYDFELVKVH
ncbi:peptidyl-prolyl cis-trans isomerase FKBP43-like [Abrus precatorius]|uniref:peptidylprolyl isomerase n=1 Tax=Abrus precatorius TaxID=3816 RepID=A0A8B8LKJ1_ABRPR|nr:peptidyl-prolyl cis-trans isomerase FKBP43-like [Abrus precatorius]